MALSTLYPLGFDICTPVRDLSQPQNTVIAEFPYWKVADSCFIVVEVYEVDTSVVPNKPCRACCLVHVRDFDITGRSGSSTVCMREGSIAEVSAECTSAVTEGSGKKIQYTVSVDGENRKISSVSILQFESRVNTEEY